MHHEPMDISKRVGELLRQKAEREAARAEKDTIQIFFRQVLLGFGVAYFVAVLVAGVIVLLTRI